MKTLHEFLFHFSQWLAAVADLLPVRSLCGNTEYCVLCSCIHSQSATFKQFYFPTQFHISTCEHCVAWCNSLIVIIIRMWYYFEWLFKSKPIPHEYLPIRIERQHNKPIAYIQFDFVKHIYKVLVNNQTNKGYYSPYINPNWTMHQHNLHLYQME